MWRGVSEAGGECGVIPLRMLFPILADRIEWTNAPPFSFEIKQLSDDRFRL